LQLVAALREKRRHTLHNLMRFAIETTAGDAGRVDAVELEGLVADAVLLEGTAAAVGLVDVEFDGETVGGPVDVELIAGDVEGGGWLGEAGLPRSIPRARPRLDGS
jgi:hypothetical protein